MYTYSTRTRHDTNLDALNFILIHCSDALEISVDISRQPILDDSVCSFHGLRVQGAKREGGGRKVTPYSTLVLYCIAGLNSQ